MKKSVYKLSNQSYDPSVHVHSLLFTCEIKEEETKRLLLITFAHNVVTGL